MARLRFAGPPRRVVAADAVAARPAAARPARARCGRRCAPAASRCGGDWREPGERMRRLVLLLDVSGSMEPYARALLRFVHAAVAGRQRVEAFALGTRLTRLTRELSQPRPRQGAAAGQRASAPTGAAARASASACAGSTTSGACAAWPAARSWSILSDGWDRGDPEVLAEQMRRLQRITYRTIWVNPLKVTPGYAPLARGMAAALPYVDRLRRGPLASPRWRSSPQVISGSRPVADQHRQHEHDQGVDHA